MAGEHAEVRSHGRWSKLEGQACEGWKSVFGAVIGVVRVVLSGGDIPCPSCESVGVSAYTEVCVSVCEDSDTAYDALA